MRLRPWYEDLSPGLGSTDSWTTAVHKKPFSTAAPEGPSRVFATTTKICTDGGSRRSRDLPFDAHRRAILLVGAYRDRRRAEAGAPAPLCRRRPSIGTTLQRHPFSELVASAGELLHTP